MANDNFEENVPRENIVSPAHTIFFHVNFAESHWEREGVGSRYMAVQGR
jgi:hypothetical protein